MKRSTKAPLAELAADPRTSADQATEALRIDILSGKFAPGDRLIEAKLSDRLSVGRGPIREALRRLETEGLVKIEAHKGATVRQISRKFIRNMFEIRELLEGLAARLTAKRIHRGANLRAFEQGLATIGEAPKRSRGPLGLSENQRFHQLIVDISGNEDLVSSSYQMQFALCRLQYQQLLARDVYGIDRQEHDAIGAAISAGNALHAERLMRRHIRRVKRDILDLPDERFSD